MTAARTPARLIKARVAVVGGGLSGLATAYRLRRLLGPAAEIMVMEQSTRLGGALRTELLAGVGYDVGAEAFLVRRPEAAALVAELGLAGEVVHPSPAAPTVRAGGRTVPLPSGTLLGLPASATSVTKVLSAAGLARLAAEPELPLRWEPGQDASVGELLRRRAGDEVIDRLVNPLLGGVYAGRADALGLRPTMPTLAAALDDGAPSLLAAAQRALPPPAAAPVPVFGTLRGGLSRLVDALADAAAIEARLGAPVRGLARRAAGWRVETGSAAAPRAHDVDAVVLAVPPPGLRRLLADVAPAAAAAAAGIELASSVVVGLALPAAAAEALPASSGVLVASGEPLTVKAFTYSTRKWAHARGEGVLLRGSLGRVGEASALRRDDAELLRAVRADLAALTGITAEPVDTVVARWGGGLPQYAVGHLDRVAAIERAVHALPGLAVAGAALHGVGIAACVATADAAARRVAEHLAGQSGARMEAWPVSTTRS